ncbi:2-dehydropantoate 2-reductase [Achromobacter sp.]|uniref:ketopantoate reductase family protein n=1 Tax=Achromobacter sp. TaxID=134375 RepID=UPI0028A9602D|nr:2-dehydropantoate 2-reductase [Achromobacter sp.]
MEKSHQCRIAVYGAGAIGCLLAARLAKASCEVSMVARGQTLSALRQHGVGLETDGTTHRYPVHATDDPAQIRGVDYLFLTVKQQALAGIAPGLVPMLAEGGTIVPAMNGIPWWYLPTRDTPLGGVMLRSVDPQGVLQRTLPLDRVLGAVVYVAAHTSAAGVATQDARNNLAIGEPDGTLSVRANRLAGLLRDGGLQCDVSPRIHEAVWMKAVGNATFNPLSVLANAGMDALVEDPYLGRLARAMLQEYLSLGKKLGLDLDVSVEQRMQAAASAGSAKTSMLQDALKGKPLEVDALIGSMVEIAEKLDRDMPYASMVWGLIRHRNLVGSS